MTSLLSLNAGKHIGISALIYFLASKIGLLLAYPPDHIALIWPAGGIALGILVISDRGLRIPLLAAFLVANFLANITSGNSSVVSFGFALANCLESSLQCWLMIKITSGDVKLNRSRDAVALIVVATAGSMISALFGAIVPMLGFGTTYHHAWLIWYSEGCLGLLVFTPLILYFEQPDITLRRLPLKMTELCLLIIITLIMTWAIFVNKDQWFHHISFMPYLLFPLMIWSAVRLGSRLTAIFYVITALLLVGLTAADFSRYPLGGMTVMDRLVNVQLFASVLGIASLIMSSVISELGMVARSLRDSESRYRSIYNDSPIAIWEEDFSEVKKRFIEIREQWGSDISRYFDANPEEVIKLAGLIKILDINPASVKLLGFTRKEDVFRDLPKYFAEESFIVFRQEMEALFRGQTRFNGEILIRRLGGETMLLDLNLAVQPGSEDSLSRVLVSFVDITESKRMASLLKDAKEDWEASFDAINDAITVHDLDFNIRRANRAAEELLGLPLLTITRQKCYESYHGTTCAPAGCPSCQALLAGKASETVVFEPHIGRYLNIKAFPRLDSSGKIVGLIHIVRDITGQKEAEEALRESEYVFQNLFNNAEIAMFRTRLDGSEVLNVNDKWLELTGLTREEAIGRPSHLLWADPVRRQEMLQILKKDGRVVDFEFQLINKKLGVRDCVASLTVYSEGGILEGSIRDMTEYRKTEAQLRQSQKMESLGLLAGGVAHDFNNILTAIIGYATLLKRKLPQPSNLHEYIDQICTASNKASDLTHSLLAFSRKEVVRMHLVNLNELILSTHSMLTRLIGEDIVLTVRSASQDIVVMADKNMISQVIVNMATNARDAMPYGGKLEIGLEAIEIPDRFKAHEHFALFSKLAMVTVSDTGLGMDAETMDRIFEPFFTTKRVGKGTGLGLAMVYGAIQSHGGVIEVESTEKMGTKFTIYLPLADVLETNEESPLRKEAVGGHETILVIDDDDAVRNVLAALLEELGYRVFTASSGEEGNEMFQRYRGEVHLIISDVVMPGKSGVDLYEALSQSDPNIRFIFISGYTADYHRRLHDISSNAMLLQKPLDAMEFARTIRNVLDS